MFATDPAPVLPPRRAEPAASRHVAHPGAVRGRARRPRTRRRGGPARLGRRQGDVGRHRRGRHLRPRRRHVPVGLGRAGRRRARRRPARQPRRRLAASSTTSATRGCPTSSSAARSSPTACSTRCGVSDELTPGAQRLTRAEGDRFEVDGTSRPCGSTGRTATTRGPGGCTPSTARSSPTSTPTERVRAVVVTGTPPAFCVGGDSEALAGHAERGGYDDGLAGELAPPGLRRAARARPRLRLPVRAALPDHRRGQRRLCRDRARRSRCSATCASSRAGEVHDGGAEARTAGGVRDELDPAPPDRRHPRRRPAPVRAGRHRRRPPSGACGTASLPDGEETLAAAPEYARAAVHRPSGRARCG